MRFFKKFRTEHVYAGPEPQGKKDEFDMGDVYAGPEQMEPVKAKRVPPPHSNDANQAMLQAVYAAPDVMERMRVRNANEPNPMQNNMQYPFNNATPDDACFKFVYASPEVFKGMVSIDPASGAKMSKGAEAETIICPKCGEKNRPGKFCEWCGNVLK